MKFNPYPGTVGTHLYGLPLTEGQWVADRDRNGKLLGWLEMFADAKGRLFSIPDASRYVANPDA